MGQFQKTQRASFFVASIATMKIISLLFTRFSSVAALTVEHGSEESFHALVSREHADETEVKQNGPSDDQVLLQNSLEAIGRKAKDGDLMQTVAQQDEQVLLQNSLEAIGRKAKDRDLMQTVAQQDEQVLLQNSLVAIGRKAKDGGLMQTVAQKDEQVLLHKDGSFTQAM
jgi:hypothetical protein